jgi:hypothetical protein
MLSHTEFNHIFHVFLTWEQCKFDLDFELFNEELTRRIFSKYSWHEQLRRLSLRDS